ncbi:MAG: fused MFS/spermidine synthase [Gammaproteobacteria bacterium]|nr:MAG: fused MFS/spermidine synthase [Gammaproteobacteria bacterium]
MSSSDSALPRGLLGTLALCFFLSGFAALLYQTAWQRAFSVVFGTSELAVATVLAVYMAGLALGAALAERFLARIRRPVRVYGLLEAGIGATALLVPFALGWAQELYAAVLGHQPLPPDARGLGQSLFYVLAGFLILVLPTALMGATLPILMRSVVRRDAEVGPRAALLYGINTAGAVAGAALGGFVLLGALGLHGTVLLGVAVNALVFLLAVALSRRALPLAPAAAADPGAAPDPTFLAACLAPLLQPQGWRRALGAQPAWILPVMALSGAATFTYEVLWTRLLSHVVGGSIFAFATMLAAFLAGIALGGGLAGPFARSRAQATTSFIVAQGAIALISLAIFVFLDALLPASRGLGVNIALATAVLLPPAVAIGATFPLAVRILSPDERLAPRCTARLYAWNTVGAIAGALIAGFWLIPTLGFEGAIRVIVTLNLALALAVTLLIRTPSLPLATACAAALAGIVLYQPARPTAVLRTSYVMSTAISGGKDLYFGVGRSSTVRLAEQIAGYRIFNNGLTEAQIFAHGAPPAFDSGNWLSALPVVARPGARSMLVVGFGGGVVVERLAPTLTEVHVVELEEKVITANRLIAATRNHDPLADPRLTVIINDARNALRLTERRYDIIVSQPSHPWTAGASHLFTTEFAALARSRLTEGGVFLQWMDATFLDAAMLRALTATLTEIFPQVRLYNPQSTDLLFVASDSPLDLERSLTTAANQPALAGYLASVGIASREDLLATLVLDERAARRFAADAPASTDDFNLMATRSRSQADGLSLDGLYEAIGDIDPLADAAFWSQVTADAQPPDFLYLASRVAMRQATQRRLPGWHAATGDPQVALRIGAIAALAGGQPQEAQRLFDEILRADPDDQAIRWLLVSTRLAEVLNGMAPRALRSEADKLTGTPAAVLAGLRHEQRGDWPAVAALDPLLAAAHPADPWYLPANRLRAGWRLQPGTTERTARAAEALVLVDQLATMRLDIPLLFQRTAAAELTGNAPAALESLAIVLERISGGLSRSSAEDPERVRMRDTFRAAESFLQAHPAWRDQPRGPLIFAFAENLQAQFDRP